MKTRPLLTVGVCCALFATSAVTSLAGDRNHDGDRDMALQLNLKLREIRIGYEIAPVPLTNIRGKNPLLVGLGSYIVNAQGSCSECHTHSSVTHSAFAPGGNPFFGEPEAVDASLYLSGGRQFGPFTSKNLTPDSAGRPGGLTFEQFKNVLRTGQDPDERGPNGLPRIQQVMPWPVIGKMTDLDLRAMYEYLRAIPALPDNPSPSP
jgi:hypothetical protein